VTVSRSDIVKLLDGFDLDTTFVHWFETIALGYRMYGKEH